MSNDVENEEEDFEQALQAFELSTKISKLCDDKEVSIILAAFGNVICAIAYQSSFEALDEIMEILSDYVESVKESTINGGGLQ